MKNQGEGLLKKGEKMNRMEIREMFGGKCAYCGEILEEKFYCNHIIPLTRNLIDRWDGKMRENIYPACELCGSRKSNKTVEEFRESIGGYAWGSKYKERPIIFWFEKYGK